eukprot:TRINITY_DN2328_c0_g1_i7.p4 TRINITY_DN2328_c0_g1~~TRINITY_DN2328_c0_g1_i7.p4  ORF type:complete len:101 (+),score=37.70 TRINITY_DN2328_c0_g1_i7:66-368(+)
MCIRDRYMGIQQKNTKAKLFCGSYYQDSPWVFACGSNKGELVLWDTKENLHVVSNFKERVSANIKPKIEDCNKEGQDGHCLLYTSPSPRDRQKSRMPSSA